jgi:hypothetical protein
MIGAQRFFLRKIDAPTDPECEYPVTFTREAKDASSYVRLP